MTEWSATLRQMAWRASETGALTQPAARFARESIPFAGGISLLQNCPLKCEARPAAARRPQLRAPYRFQKQARVFPRYDG